jgi:chromosome segregation ATPase
MVSDRNAPPTARRTLESSTMSSATPSALNAQLDDVTEKVERLALRHAELRRTNALLEQRVLQLEAERDALRARLGEARTRVDRLIERLPTTGDTP